MKRNKVIITALSALSILLLLIVYILNQGYDKENYVKEGEKISKIAELEINDLDAENKKALERFIIAETDSGTYIFNAYRSHKVKEITYLEAVPISPKEQGAFPISKNLYEAINEPELLYEKEPGFVHYYKVLGSGIMYHRMVLYDIKNLI